MFPSKYAVSQKLFSSQSSRLIIHDWERPYYKPMVTELGLSSLTLVAALSAVAPSGAVHCLPGPLQGAAAVTWGVSKCDLSADLGAQMPKPPMPRGTILMVCIVRIADPGSPKVVAT